MRKPEDLLVPEWSTIVVALLKSDSCTDSILQGRLRRRPWLSVHANSHIMADEGVERTLLTDGTTWLTRWKLEVPREKKMPANDHATLSMADPTKRPWDTRPELTEADRGGNQACSLADSMKSPFISHHSATTTAWGSWSTSSTVQTLLQPGLRNGIKTARSESHQPSASVVWAVKVPRKWKKKKWPLIWIMLQ